LISAEPSAIDRGIPLRTKPAQRPRLARFWPLPKEKPRRRRGSKFWDERTQRVVELVPPAPMRNRAWGSALCIKNFWAVALRSRPNDKFRSFPRKRESRPSRGPRFRGDERRRVSWA
jgi:hypothetical protein